LCRARFFKDQIFERPDFLRALMFQGSIINGLNCAETDVQGWIVWGQIVQGWIVPVTVHVIHNFKRYPFNLGSKNSKF
jgi:hypothetical protein